jgi:hypothetical protein
MKSTYSIQDTPEKAVEDISLQLREVDTKMILFFTSSVYNPQIIGPQMQSAFTNIPVFGCSTAGEIVSGKLLKKSIVAMAFEPEIIQDVNIEVIDVTQENAVDKAFANFEKYFHVGMLDMDPDRYVGILLIDGLSVAEERIIERIGDLTDVTFVGGSAGDDLKFERTYVFANGKAYTNAAVLALLKTGVKFDVIKTQSFCELPKHLVATKVNEQKRSVIEFNGKPASDAYAESLGISVGEAAKCFMHNPVGLMVDKEPFIRSPQQIKDGSMVFYCHVKEGMKLSLMESTNIVEHTQKAIEAKAHQLGGLAGIINFHCILRTLDLEYKNLTEAYGRLFSDTPTIGFSTYGEQYIGHINQTSTMLVFKKPQSGQI